MGFDRLHDRPIFQLCIADSSLIPVNPDVTKESTRMVLEKIEKSEDFDKVFSLNVSVSAKWGGGGGSANYNRVSQQSSSDYELRYVIGEEILDATERLTRADLNDQGKTALSKGPDAFFETCGSDFVGTRQRGARFLGLLSEHVNENQDILTEAGQLKADIGGWLSGDVEASQRIKTRVSSNDLEIQASDNGGLSQLMIFSPDQFVEKAKAWEQSTINPKQHAVINLFYYPYVSSGKKISSPQYSIQLVSLRVAAERFDEIQKLRADTAYVKGHPDLFFQKQSDHYLASLATLDQTEDSLGKAARGCLKSSASCGNIQSIRVPSVTPPIRIPWVYPSVSTESPTRIGAVGSDKKVRKLIVKGQWSLWAAPGRWMNPWDYDYSWAGIKQGLFVRFSRESGGEIEVIPIPAGGEVLVPQDADDVIVELFVKDGNPSDNRSDHLRAAVIDWNTVQ